MFDNFGQAATGWRHNHGSLTPLVFGFSVMPHQVPSSQRAVSKEVCGRCIGAWRQCWQRFLADPLADSPYGSTCYLQLRCCAACCCGCLLAPPPPCTVAVSRDQ
eukprot:COSAG01_NODE_659_length_14436_cov_15.108112_13_plen_104_part_00